MADLPKKGDSGIAAAALNCTAASVPTNCAVPVPDAVTGQDHMEGGA
jgi:hypothetical protein